VRGRRTNTCMAYHRTHWRVTVRKANYSAFNGGHRTPSAYSEVHCIDCGRIWRTKAAYVDTLRDYN
jgi:hypothetical protein